MVQIFPHGNVWKMKAREKTPNFWLVLQGGSQANYHKSLFYIQHCYQAKMCVPSSPF